jgi:hypothetical protein
MLLEDVKANIALSVSKGRLVRGRTWWERSHDVGIYYFMMTIGLFTILTMGDSFISWVFGILPFILFVTLWYRTGSLTELDLNPLEFSNWLIQQVSEGKIGPQDIRISGLPALTERLLSNTNPDMDSFGDFYVAFQYPRKMLASERVIYVLRYGQRTYTTVVSIGRGRMISIFHFSADRRAKAEFNKAMIKYVESKRPYQAP